MPSERRMEGNRDSEPLQCRRAGTERRLCRKATLKAGVAFYGSLMDPPNSAMPKNAFEDLFTALRARALCARATQIPSTSLGNFRRLVEINLPLDDGEEPADPPALSS